MAVAESYLPDAEVQRLWAMLNRQGQLYISDALSIMDTCHKYAPFITSYVEAVQYLRACLEWRSSIEQSRIERQQQRRLEMWNRRIQSEAACRNQLTLFEE